MSRELLWSRLLSVPVALGAGGVLGTAAWLTPSAGGHATHLQLGLGQCTFLSWTGYPCPMCGMTTTFALLAHFHPLVALRTQPFGIVLFALTLGAFAIAVAESVVPTDRWRRLWAAVEPHENVLATLFLVGMGLGWLWKIALMHYFHWEHV